MSLFISGQSDFLISSVDFLDDYKKEKKHFKKVTNLESLFFINCEMGPDLYSDYLTLLQGRINYANKKTYREHFVVLFVSQLSFSKMMNTAKSNWFYVC